MTNVRNITGTVYSVDEVGNVFIFDGDKLNTEKRSDGIYIHLDLGIGVKEYNVAILVLLAFNKIKLDHYLIENIEPLFIDNDNKNICPVNVLYRFKKHPLSVCGRPGYFYIPFFTNYGVSENGSVINIETGITLSEQVCNNNSVHKNVTGGYRYVRIKSDTGHYKNLLVHRAVSFAFIKYESNVLRLDCNHIDGVPWNNHYKNLEWCTRRHNNLHAVSIGLKKQSKAVLAKNILTGVETRYPSIMFCARALGYQRTNDVIRRINYSNMFINEDMVAVKYDDGEPWPKFDLDKITIVSAPREVKARNVFTGDLVVFNNQSECARLLGLKPETVRAHIENKRLIPINGWNFKDIDDESDWPAHTGRHLLSYKEYPTYPPDGVIVEDLKENTELYFTSTTKACEYMKIDKHTFFNHTRRSRLFNNRYNFKIFDLRKNLGHPME